MGTENRAGQLFNKMMKFQGLVHFPSSFSPFPCCLSHEERHKDEKQEGQTKPHRRLGTETLLGSGCCSLVLALAPLGLCRGPSGATGALVQGWVRGHIFHVGNPSFQQLQQHSRTDSRFLAGPFPSACLGHGETDPGERLSWLEPLGKFSLHG